MPRPIVQSQFVTTPAASPAAIGARVLAIIATGSDSFTIQERIQRGGTSGSGSTDALVHGATATAIVKVGMYKGTTDFTLNTDYQLGTGGDAGKIKWLGTSNYPALQSFYYVTYTYTKAATDYDPVLYTDFNSVLSDRGVIHVTTGVLDVKSYATLAAQVAFDVGVRQLIIVQPVTNDTDGFSDAYDKLEKTISGVDPYYIVPMLGSLGTLNAFNTAKGTALAHCHKMASPEFGKERRLYTGRKDYSGTGADVVVDSFIDEAEALMDSQVTLSGNADPVRVIGTEDVVLDGCFDALSKAAYRSTQFASDPMMNRPIVGAFSGFNTTWGDIDVDNLVDAGVCVSENVAGVIKVVDDITTNTSDEIEVDISTVEARDVLISLNRKAVKDKFQGARGTNSISSDLKSFEGLFLDRRLGEGLIAGIGKYDASRVSGSLRQWQITFTYLPVTKVRDIFITFSVDLGLAA